VQLKPNYVHLGISIGIGFLLLATKLPAAYAWQLGWSTTASANDLGIGSVAYVGGGLNCVNCSFLATSGFTDAAGIWRTVALIDENNGGTIAAMGIFQW
jgi:hypothetical protein